MKQHPEPSRLTLLVAAMAIGLTAAAWAESPAEPAIAEAPAATSQPAGDDGAVQAVQVAGMQVFIDPETGRLRPPTAEERRQLGEALRKTFARQPNELGASYRHSNGMLSHVVGPDHLNFSVATVDAEGELSTDCVHGPERARAHAEARPDHGHDSEER